MFTIDDFAGKRRFRITLEVTVESLPLDEPSAGTVFEVSTPANPEPTGEPNYASDPSAFADLDSRVADPRLQRLAREWVEAVAASVPGRVVVHSISHNSVAIKVDGVSVCQLSPSRYHLRVIPIGHDNRVGDLIRESSDFVEPLRKVRERLGLAEQ